MTRVSNAFGSETAAATLAAVTIALGPVAAADLEFAIISPARVTIGKNVRIEGAIGTRFGVVAGEMDAADGDPIVMRSDFEHLDPALDATLEILHAQIVTFDVNGDNRLRIDHPIESVGLAGFPDLTDYDRNGDVDDFDLFLRHYDADGDGRVTYPTLSPASRLAARGPEFAGVDDRLARLIDTARPDRDGNGRITYADRERGYGDGVLDGRDAYGKVHGRLALAVSRAEWEAARGGSYQVVVTGPIRPDDRDDAVGFEVTEDDLPEITREMFGDAVWFEGQVPSRVAREPGDPPIDPARLVGEAIAAGPFAEYVAGADGAWEGVPYLSSGVFDFYRRPVYRDYTFRNVRIPTGNNALFVNCTFVGVTFVESEPRCTHVNWNYVGARERVYNGMGGYTYELRFPDLFAVLDGVEIQDTRAYSNNIRFDGCTFLGSVAGDLLEEHAHWRNRVQFSGVTRVFLDAGEVEPPTLADAAGNLLVDYLAAMTDAERAELATSSLFLPGWSAHLRNLDAPAVRLRGLIVSDIFEAVGTLDIHGTLVSAFRPVEGEGTLYYGGHPSAFVTTLGFFPAEEVQGFGAITVRYDPDARLPLGLR